jgi:hypothetical protein
MHARLAALAVTLFVLSFAAAGQASVGSAVAKPALRTVPGAGLTVRGTGFAPRERVTVTLLAVNAKRSAVVVASSTGTFTARLAYKPPRCSVWQVRAKGATTGIVVLRSPVRECAPVDGSPSGSSTSGSTS